MGMSVGEFAPAPAAVTTIYRKWEIITLIGSARESHQMTVHALRKRGAGKGFTYVRGAF
jgi:hypothetical protein